MTTVLLAQSLADCLTRHATAESPVAMTKWTAVLSSTESLIVAVTAAATSASDSLANYFVLQGKDVISSSPLTTAEECQALVASCRVVDDAQAWTACLGLLKRLTSVTLHTQLPVVYDAEEKAHLIVSANDTLLLGTLLLRSPASEVHSNTVLKESPSSVKALISTTGQKVVAEPTAETRGTVDATQWFCCTSGDLVNSATTQANFIRTHCKPAEGSSSSSSSTAMEFAVVLCPTVICPLIVPRSLLRADASRRALHRALRLENRPYLTTAPTFSNSGNTLELVEAYASRCQKVAEATRALPQDVCVPEGGRVFLPPRSGAKWESHLAMCPHLKIPLSKKLKAIPNSVTAVVKGPYDYYHYQVDGFNDDGWGCAYRSLQTVLSWFQYQGLLLRAVPTIVEIQQILLRVDPAKLSVKNFVGSKEWIGSYEVMLVLSDLLPQMDCILRRLDQGSQLDSDSSIQQQLVDHFASANGGCPVMIGGSSYAHTILGLEVNVETNEASYLVLDPHYCPKQGETDVKNVTNKGFCGWKKASQFFEGSVFYNLCLPKVGAADFS